jgi:hypothetical protein
MSKKRRGENGEIIYGNANPLYVSVGNKKLAISFLSNGRRVNPKVDYHSLDFEKRVSIKQSNAVYIQSHIQEHQVKNLPKFLRDDLVSSLKKIDNKNSSFLKTKQAIYVCFYAKNVEKKDSAHVMYHKISNYNVIRSYVTGENLIYEHHDGINKLNIDPVNIVAVVENDNNIKEYSVEEFLENHSFYYMVRKYYKAKGNLKNLVI